MDALFSVVDNPQIQDLLWEYAQRRREADPAFAEDLEEALQRAGFKTGGLSAHEQGRMEADAFWEGEIEGLLQIIARLVGALTLTPEGALDAKRVMEATERAEAALREMDFRYCRVCGCSENDACPPTCAWVEPDLCSSCASPKLVVDNKQTGG